MLNKYTTSQKLLCLKKYLLGKKLYKEAYALGKTILASDQSSSEHDSSDETVDLRGNATVALSPRPWRSLSEPHLLKAELEPIRFIAGTEAGKRGEGKSSKEGNIYEVLYKGKVAVAKVLSGFDPAEPDIWKKILEIKKTLTEEEAKHLPEIYDIIKTDRYTTVIVMELLSPPNAHMRRVLRTQEGRDRDLILRDEEFLSEALTAAFESLEEFRPDPENKVDSEIYAMFDAESTAMRQSIEGGLIRKELLPEEVSERIQNFASSYINMFNLEDSGLTKTIADEIENKLIRHISSSSRPIAKYYSPKGIDHTLTHIHDSSASGDPVNQGVQRKIDILNEERAASVYSENPESFLYSEKYMPETKGFFSMLNKLKEQGVEWSDVHANNIMERPGTRDLVLIDVGLFG